MDDDTKIESPDEKPGAMMNTKQLMAELGVSKATLFAILKSGDLPSVLVGPRGRRVRRYDFDEYVRNLPTSIPAKPLKAAS